MKRQKEFFRFVSLFLLGLFLSGCFAGPAIFKEQAKLGEGKEWRMYPLVVNLDNEKQVEIIAAHRRPMVENSLHVWTVAGTGEFREHPQTWTSPGYSALATADINHDGKLDIVAGSHFNRIHTFMSQPGERYREIITPSSDGYVVAKLIDLDSDGNLELVLLGNERAGLQIYRPEPDGSLVHRASLIEGKIGRDLKVIDMNNDKRLDLVASFAKTGIMIFLQNEKGGWDSTTLTNLVSATNEFKTLAIADFNKDGWQDIALNGGFTGVGKPNGPDVYLSNGKDGTFSPALDGLKIFKNPAEGLGVADFDGDGNLDIFAGGNITGRVDGTAFGLFLFLGDGKGSWTLYRNSGLPKEGLSRSYGTEVADLDHNGLMDVVVIHGDPEEGGGYVSVWSSSPSKS